jgi:hypothetical protein
MTTAAHEMEEWKKGDPESANGSADDDDTLLPEHEFQFATGSMSDSEDEDGTNEAGGSGRRGGFKSSLWVVLVTMATLAGRRILRGGFRESFCLIWFCLVGLNWVGR